MDEIRRLAVAVLDDQHWRLLPQPAIRMAANELTDEAHRPLARSPEEMMAELDKSKAVELLNRILEAEL